MKIFKIQKIKKLFLSIYKILQKLINININIVGESKIIWIEYRMLLPLISSWYHQRQSFWKLQYLSLTLQYLFLTSKIKDKSVNYAERNFFNNLSWNDYVVFWTTFQIYIVWKGLNISCELPLRCMKDEFFNTKTLEL